jgi:xylose isomerase
MDTLARALLAAARLIEDGNLQGALDARYAGWSGNLGRGIREGKLQLADLWQRTLDGAEDPRPVSGGQERLENRVRDAIERS